MEKSLFIVLAVCLMLSGVSGVSESMSCSMVNGQMICDKQTSSGNAAMASSSALSGPQGSSQSTYAGAGNPGANWESTGQRVSTGNGGFSANNDYFDFDDADFKGDTRGSDYPSDEECSYTSSSSSSPNIGSYAGPNKAVFGLTPVVGGFGFASAGNFFSPGMPSTFVSGFISTPQGGPSGGGMSFSSSSSGSAPNFGGNAGPMPSAGGFGFATAGNAMPPGFPFNFVPGFGYPPQQPPLSSDAGNSGGSYAGAGNAGGGFAGPGNTGGGFAGPGNGGGVYTGAFAGAGNFGPRNFGPGNFDPMAYVFGRR